MIGQIIIPPKNIFFLSIIDGGVNGEGWRPNCSMRC